MSFFLWGAAAFSLSLFLGCGAFPSSWVGGRSPTLPCLVVVLSPPSLWVLLPSSFLSLFPHPSLSLFSKLNLCFTTLVVSLHAKNFYSC